jgi:hypothetical protein
VTFCKMCHPFFYEFRVVPSVHCKCIKYVYIKNTTVYVPSSELVLSQPTPLSPANVPLPPERGGAHSFAGEGLGESQLRRLEKKLSILPTLCVNVFNFVCCTACYYRHYRSQRLGVDLDRRLDH